MNKKTIYLLLTVSIFLGFVSTLVSQEPSVSITAEPTGGQAPLTVKFAADVTDPFEGKHPVTYDWIFGDNTASTKKAPGHTFTDAGTYTVVCKVTFWKSPKVTVEDSIEINVVPPPPLEVSISGNPTSGPAPLTVSFTSNVSGGTGAPVEYAWNFGDGSTSTEANPTHIFNSAGTYKVTCSVTDTDDPALNALDSFEINVSPPPLEVSINAEPTSGPAPLTVKFTCTVSGGTDAVDTYAWDFGDETTTEGANPSHIFIAPGTYNVTCTVTDTSTPPTTKKASIEITVTQLWPAAVCTAANNQLYPQITTDGSNGAIIAWQDYRSGSNYDVYTRRVSNTGETLWSENGVSISTTDGNVSSVPIVSDGSGGAVMTWYDASSDYHIIYAQSIKSDGTIRWAVNGVVVCEAGINQSGPQLISDGSGGAVITWYDSRSGNYDIYAQRINGEGSIQWKAADVSICTAANTQGIPQIVPDGSGGAVITWYDNRSGNSDIYAQRINSEGVVQWEANGMPICKAVENQLSPQITIDGSGGAIITWQDYRSGGDGNWDIYAQSISGEGNIRWAADGVPVSTAANSQSGPRIIPDGSGGAVITWQDYRAGNTDIYAQRINSEGVVQWEANGVAVCTLAFNQQSPQLTTDGSGGAVITWQDYRSESNWDIYAQHINSAGEPQWAVNGVVVCSADNDQGGPQLIPDGSGGAIITWYDRRSGNYDIYAQRITKDGELLK